MTPDPRGLLRAMFDAAVAAALPERIVPPHLPPPPRGRTIVLGAGKASAAMAKVVEDRWGSPLEGLVVTRYGHAVPCRTVEIVEAAHPVPDAAGEAAARRVLELARSAGPDDLVLCLISGGGSSLLALPAEGLTLADKQAVNKALLASGADIGQMNAVRKHLSAVKGGRLAAAAHPAKVVSLLISDVPGDEPTVIASGPTVPDPSTFADARAILARYGIVPPAAVRAHLERAADETPKLGDSLEGEAREVGRVMAGVARSVVAHGQPLPPPCVLLSGGETTVTVKGEGGRGGRNAEFLLGLAVQLGGLGGTWAIAGDTDGIDGSEDNAGAVVTPDSLERARALGLKPAELLARNDAFAFFEALGDLVTTGPTLTNVNDFRAVLVTG